MNISAIQKRKFLNNLYLNLYANGSKPNEREIRRIFNQYFSTNQLGRPIRIGFEELIDSAILDPITFNKVMAKIGLNIELIYDFINENNEELMSTVTSLDKKLTDLRSKRNELEAKVDDLIFSINNSDGYFYSYTENFSSISNIDLFFTNAFVNTPYNHVELPTLLGEGAFAAASQFILGSPTFTISGDNSFPVTEIDQDSFNLAIDGLNDTYWSYSYSSSQNRIYSLDLNLPVSSSRVLGEVSGIILSQKPTTIILEAQPFDGSDPIVRVKDSLGDFGRFSFSINSGYYNSIKLRFLKMQPDVINYDVENIYTYNFGIRELYIGSQYYDNRAIVVSKPISVPQDQNKLLSIDSVAIDIKSQIPEDTEIRFYLATDKEDVVGIESFNWIPISPANDSSPRYSQVVNLRKQNYVKKLIELNPSSSGSWQKIPINNLELEESSLGSPLSQRIPLNVENPSSSIYFNKNVFRITEIPETEFLVDPFILSGLNSAKRYFRAFNNSYKDLNQWSEYLQSKDYLGLDILRDQAKAISPGTRFVCSGLVEIKILSNKDQEISHLIRKNRNDFNLGYYVNNVLAGDVPNGISSKEVTTNLSAGINNIIITYDKNFVGDITFELVSGSTLGLLGDVFLDLFKFLDPIEFRNDQNINAKNFTIDNFLGKREIITNQDIGDVSQISYYSEGEKPIGSVRFRADLVRYENPYTSPLLDSVRVKFKHIDIGV
jgi:hypothetical protein